VLQTDKIYVNVAKGELAQKKDLEEHFKGMSYQDIVKLILEKGEIQVSEKERDMNFNNMRNEIANIIVEKTFDVDTGQKFSQEMILQALNDLNFIVKSDKPVKPQAIQAIKHIQDMKILNLERKFLEVQIVLKEKFLKSDDFEKKFPEISLNLIDYLNQIQSKLNNKAIENNNNFKIVCDIKPNFYRELQTKFEDYIAVEILANAKVITDDSNKNNADNLIKEIKHNKEEKKTNEMKISNQYIEKFLEDNYPEEVNTKAKKKTINCTKCKGCVFLEQSELRTHYKSDLHVFNVKRAAKGDSPLDMEEYIDHTHLNK